MHIQQFFCIKVMETVSFIGTDYKLPDLVKKSVFCVGTFAISSSMKYLYTRLNCHQRASQIILLNTVVLSSYASISAIQISFLAFFVWIIQLI